MKYLFAVLASLTFTTAAAQQVQVDQQIVRSCFQATAIGDTSPACLGQASNTCQQAGNSTTLGITDCIRAEAAVWDTMLNQAYSERRADFARRGAVPVGGYDLTDTLRDAQRAWIAYRDAECTLAFARWQDGSIRHIVGANCLMTMTAQRAIELRDMKDN